VRSVAWLSNTYLLACNTQQRSFNIHYLQRLFLFCCAWLCLL